LYVLHLISEGGVGKQNKSKFVADNQPKAEV